MSEKTTKSQRTEIAVFALVLLFCLFAGYRILGGGQAKARSSPSGRSLAVDRSPAATEGSKPQEVLQEVDGAVEILQLPCQFASSKTDDKTEEIKTKAKLLRLSFEFCKASLIPEKSFGKNESNGWNILLLGEKNTPVIATSFFPLQEGKNEILLSIHQKTGVYERRISILKE